MFFGKTTATKQEVNVNTKLFSSYSDTALVNADAWNAQLSIKVRPCVGTDANGTRQYAEDRSQIIYTSITQDNAICLVDGFEKEVLPAVKGVKVHGDNMPEVMAYRLGGPYTISGFRMNGVGSGESFVMGSAEQRKILTIGYENKEAYFSIAINLDAEGKAGTVIRHVFNKKEYLVNYDPNVGKPEESSVESELFGFMHKVNAVKDFAPIVPHAIKYSDASRASYTNNNSNNTSNYNNYNNQNTQNTNSGYQAPTTAVEGNDMDFLTPWN